MPAPLQAPDDALALPEVFEAIRRQLVTIRDNRITYHLNHERSYNWNDPEEWVRCATIAWLVVVRDYPPQRIKVEVAVPRRTPNDSADIVVFTDDRCTEPYLVVEAKASRAGPATRRQAVEQLFGNANSLRSPLALYDDGGQSSLFNVADFPATERTRNRLGTRDALPHVYGELPAFALIAGGPTDIRGVDSVVLAGKVKRAHGILWAGGKRDPLMAFDEWSKLLFAKVIDERRTPTGEPRRFQVGTNEEATAVANRVHRLFEAAMREDASIFPPESRIALPDNKIKEVAEVLAPISFNGTGVDAIGEAFEEFFASVFRGGLGQYFTMRPLARFAVAVLDIRQSDYVLDPTAGSGGFLLEVLLQTWHRMEEAFGGQGQSHVERLKTDFALGHVFGIEIHDILSRICKINLLLHHDGHTNIEAGRSCLDSTFRNPRLNPPRAQFTRIVGNPPFGDSVEAGDADKLGEASLEDFTLAAGRSKVESEQLILERAVDLLEPGGRLGFIVPDGLLNNQGENSNCPRTRRYLATNGFVEAIVSLPDHAFRRSGAQNKTSILFFRKFSTVELRAVTREFTALKNDGIGEDAAIPEALRRAGFAYRTFLAEANHVGYSPSGGAGSRNDLCSAGEAGLLATDQSGTILGEWRRFATDPLAYQGCRSPDCVALDFGEMWESHASHRMDPKYHVFKHEGGPLVHEGWSRTTLATLLQRRMEVAAVAENPEAVFTVLTISQTGTLRPRAAGKGRNPPEWTGAYLDAGASQWYSCHSGDVVYSSIDLWKGCIAVVPEAFDRSLVTKEFPVYQVDEALIRSDFLQALLRTRYYQRAFRAITTGHSNRRRTQQDDFEALEIIFPVDLNEQERLAADLQRAAANLLVATAEVREAGIALSDLVDGRGTEDLPEVGSDDDDDDE